MLNSIGFPGLVLIAFVVLVLFGRGRVGALMADAGRGITAFRRGLRDEGDTPQEQQAAPPDAARLSGGSRGQ